MSPRFPRFSYLKYLKFVGRLLGILLLHVLAAIAGDRILTKWKARKSGATASSDAAALQEPAPDPGKGKSHPRLSKATHIILTWLRIILLFVAGLILLAIIGAFGEFQYLLRSFKSNAGMNPWIAKSIALIFLLAYAYGSIILFSIRSHRRRRGLLVLVVTLLAFNGLMYGMTRSNLFHPSSGKAQKYYSVRPDGTYRLFDHSGFDPDTGDTLRPVTPDMAKLMEANRSLGFSTLTDPSEFFDPVSGAPRVWFYRHKDGGFELFSSPGHHPRYQTPLQPMTPAAAREYETWRAGQETQAAAERTAREAQAKSAQDAARLGRLINYQALGSVREGRVLLGISGDGASEGVQALMSGLAALVQEKGMHPVDGVFRPAFYGTNDFESLLGGDESPLGRLQLGRDGVLLGRIGFKEAASENFEGLVSVRATLSLASFAPGKHKHRTKVFSAVGPGFNAGDAAQKAAERIVSQVKSDGSCLDF